MRKIVSAVPGRDLVLMGLVCVVWGFMFIAGKFAVNEIPPMVFMMLRHLLLFVAVSPFLRWVKGEMFKVCMVGLTFGGAQFGFVYGALAMTENVSAVILTTLIAAPLTTLMSMVFLREAVGLWRWGGIFVTFIGVFVVFVEPILADDVYAMGLAAIGMIFGAIGTLFMRRIRGAGTLNVQGWAALTAFPCFFIATYGWETGQWEALMGASALAWGGVVFAALVGTLVGHAGMYILLQRHAVAVVSGPTMLAPIIGVLFSVMIFGDALTLRVVFGGLLAVVGAGVILMREGKGAPAGASTLSAGVTASSDLLKGEGKRE